MKSRLIKHLEADSVNIIVNSRICCGCGTCSVACPTSAISMIYGDRFNYPAIKTVKCISCQKCLIVCPSRFLLNDTNPDVNFQAKLDSSAAYLIHAKDLSIRRDSASGGFITGLFIYLLKNNFIDGCIVSRCEGKTPLVAETYIAKDREAIIAGCGSKYAPVSACTAIKDVIKVPGRYTFIGTPCMLEGLAKLEKIFPTLKDSIVLKIGFVCAGMASRLSTKNYIEQHGNVNMQEVRKICYRGDGWPGRFRVFGDDKKLLMDNPLLGGSLKYLVGIDHYLRCDNCLDHWSYYADIIVSDPWKAEMIETEKLGRSAIMINNETGRNAITPAIEDGFFIADSISVDEMINFNKHLFISDTHEVHSWQALYQVIFKGRFKFLLPIFRYLIKGQLRGLRTTLKARFAKRYFY